MASNNMKTKTFWRKTLIGCGSFWLAIGGVLGVARAATITLTSDGTTLCAPLGQGTTTPAQLALLDAGNTSGLTFGLAAVGGFGTFTDVPPNSPSGTQVINITPTPEQNGFFRITFTLPAGFSGISLTGTGNVDNAGRVFINGNPITPSLSSGDPAVLTQFGNVGFSTTNAAYFQPGINTLLLADANTTGGPSGAAFYATINYAVPEPSTWGMLGVGVAAMAVVARRRLVR